MALVMTLPPAAALLATAEATQHSRITSADGLEAARVQAALEWVQNRTWRQLVLATFEERLDCWEPVIKLQRGPVRSVDSILYKDANGTLQTLSTDDYQVDTESEVCRIAPAYGESWPTLRGDLNDVRITYKAGHVVPFTVDDTTDVLTATGHWFADTDPVRMWNSSAAPTSNLPAGLGGSTVYARDVSGNTLKVAATSGGSAIDITGTGTGTHFLGECPWWARAAVLLLFGELNEQREQSIAGVSASRAVLAAQDLVDPYRLPL